MKAVSKMDTDNCHNAIMRFIKQRGPTSTIISENGTNFVDAEQEFSQYVKKGT